MPFKDLEYVPRKKNTIDNWVKWYNCDIWRRDINKIINEYKWSFVCREIGRSCHIMDTKDVMHKKEYIIKYNDSSSVL